MNDTEYAYAAASVRANENTLLTRADFEQLIAAQSTEEVYRSLADKGFSEFGGRAGDLTALNVHMENTWNYLTEIAPEKSALDFLIVKNDFHNLKAVLKGIMANTDGRRYALKPCLVPVDELYGVAANRDFDSLPDWLSAAAAEGYSLLTSTCDGQLSDIMLDRMSIETMRDMAARNSFAAEYANEAAALYDLKIALRAAKTSANETICSMALCECDSIDTGALSEAASRGAERVAAYIENSPYASLAEYTASAAEFERRCDARLYKLSDRARLVSFGIEPLVAYYLAREAETKNLRIIINAKRAQIDDSAVRERMCDIYV